MLGTPAKNSFISNFRLSRPFLVVVAAFALMEFIPLKIYKFAENEVNLVVRYKRELARTNAISQMSAGKDVVLFLGNSKITAGIVPQIFDQINGGDIFSFNLSLPALPLGPQYYLLKDYLKHNPAPTYIVISLQPGDYKHQLMPYYAPIEAGLGEIMRYTWYRQNLDILINYLLPLRFHWYEVKRFCMGKMLSIFSKEVAVFAQEKYVQHMQKTETFAHDWDQLFKMQYFDFDQTRQAREELLKDDRGYHYFMEQAAVGGALPDNYMPKSVDWKAPDAVNSANTDLQTTIHDPLMDKFFELANANHIRVLLISDYGLLEPGGQPAKAEVPELWKTLRGKYPNVFYIRPQRHWYEAKYFSDPVHVNPNGAIKYTVDVAEEFKILNNYLAGLQVKI